jgi:hypothetical protein
VRPMEWGDSESAKSGAPLLISNGIVCGRVLSFACAKTLFV